MPARIQRGRNQRENAGHAQHIVQKPSVDGHSEQPCRLSCGNSRETAPEYTGGQALKEDEDRVACPQPDGERRELPAARRAPSMKYLRIRDEIAVKTRRLETEPEIDVFQIGKEFFVVPPNGFEDRLSKNRRAAAGGKHLSFLVVE